MFHCDGVRFHWGGGYVSLEQELGIIGTGVRIHWGGG